MVAGTFDIDGNGTVDSPFAVSGPPSGDGNPFGAVALGDGSSGSGDVDALGNRFDPDIHVGRDNLNSDGSYRKKRGRKSGSGERPAGAQRTRKTASDYSASLDALTNTLVIVHAGLASVSKIKEFELEKDEAKSLAVAVGNVLAEFDIQPDPKMQAIVGLVVAAGAIYGPRMYLYQERVKEEKAKAKAATALHVVGA